VGACGNPSWAKILVCGDTDASLTSE